MKTSLGEKPLTCASRPWLKNIACLSSLVSLRINTIASSDNLHNKNRTKFSETSTAGVGEGGSISSILPYRSLFLDCASAVPTDFCFKSVREYSEIAPDDLTLIIL